MSKQVGLGERSNPKRVGDDVCDSVADQRPLLAGAESQERLAIVDAVVAKATSAGSRIAVAVVGANEVEGEVPDNGQVLSGMLRSGSVAILTEGNIEAPVKLVLDQPLITDASESLLGSHVTAADVETGLCRCLARQDLFARGFDGDEAIHVWPPL